jgi:hypothetical protein
MGRGRAIPDKSIRRTTIMHKRLGILFVVVLVAAGLSLAAGEKAKETSYVGWVTDTHCGAKGAKEGHADCATKCVKEQGAKYALVTPSDGKVYVLDPQAKAPSTPATRQGHRHGRGRDAQGRQDRNDR